MSRVGQFFGKMFSGPAEKNETLLRAYGKLPFYAEYRRMEVSPGTPTLFSQWLDAGRLAWARSATAGGKGALRGSRLLIQLPDTKESIVARLWDSRDSLGRVFPFAFFIVCPPEALGAEPVARWTAALSVCECFERFHAELGQLARGGNFYKVYGKRAIPIRPDDAAERTERLRRAAAAVSGRDWFKAISLDGEIDAGRWFSALAHRARRWQAKPALLADQALRCPLAQGIAYEAQAALWLEWIGRFGKKAARMPAIIVPAAGDAGPASLHLIARNLLPDDYQVMTTDDRTYGYVDDLAGAQQHADDAPVDPPTGGLSEWLAQHAAAS